MKQWLLILVGISVFAYTGDAQALPFRPGLLPNGFVNACSTCHFNPAGGGARNAFGQDVDERVSPFGSEAFWGPELAALDSDGDGFTNGEELGDPEGLWESGQPSPGAGPLVSRPGVATSTPPAPHEAAGVTASVQRPGAAKYFYTSLSGANVTVPVTTDGVGTGTFTLNEEGLHYQITVTGLSGPITNAHFHNAAAGSNGGVVRGISETFVGGTSSGVWSSDDSSPLSDAMIEELLAGRIYVNIHTGANPGGEIRGQVTLPSGTGFSAPMDAGQETATVLSDGSGTATFAFDPFAGLSFWITVDGLTGPITAAHIHRAPAGENGSPVRTLTELFAGGTASGVWRSFDDEPLTAELIQDLVDGNLYVNVHTAANGPGEIRGQIHVAAANPGGMKLEFARSIAGNEPVYAYRGYTSASGSASVNIVDTSGRFRRSGAGGYYVARLTGPAGRVLSEWNSIPVRSARQAQIDLPSGARAVTTTTTPFAMSATRPASDAGSSAIQPAAPSFSLGMPLLEKRGQLLIPVEVTGASVLGAADLTVTTSAPGLRLESASLDGTPLQIASQSQGQTALIMDSQPIHDTAQLDLRFTSASLGAVGDIQLDGLLFDTDLLPLAEIDIRVEMAGSLPGAYALHPAFPNPFNPSTQIRYALPEAADVRLVIFNRLGQEVARLVESHQSAGVQAVTWDAAGFSSGTYFVRLEAGNFSQVQRMVLLK